MYINTVAPFSDNRLETVNRCFKKFSEAEMKNDAAQDDDPSLCSVLMDLVGWWEKMDRPLQRRGVPLSERGEIAAGVGTRTQSSFSFSFLFFFTFFFYRSCSCPPAWSPSNAQLSSPLWSCTNPAKRAFVPAWHRHICSGTRTSHSCCYQHH